MEPSFTKEELNKLTITPEDLAHYSQPDELKRLLLERNYYKLVLEKQNENINTASRQLDAILDAPVSITRKTYSNIFGIPQTRLISKSARDIIFEYKINNLAERMIYNPILEQSKFTHNFKFKDMK